MLKEALCHRVVVAVAAPAHAGDQTMGVKEDLPFIATELATTDPSR